MRTAVAQSQLTHACTLGYSRATGVLFLPLPDDSSRGVDPESFLRQTAVRKNLLTDEKHLSPSSKGMTLQDVVADENRSTESLEMQSDIHRLSVSDATF